MDRKLFYAAARQQLGALTQANVVGFNLVLDEAHRRGARLHDLAYILATAWWESGRTMQPVKEAFWLSEAWRRKNLRYYPFYGRGLVQLTWEANYKKASDLYGVDFVKAPDLVMEPKHSVNILFDGMTHGWFTGKDLGDYIDAIDESDPEDLREFSNARRIVNGTDKQVEIGNLALVFEAALKASGYAQALAVPAVPIPTPRPPAPTQEPAMPVPTTSPVEKAIGAGKGAATGGIVGGVGGAILILMSGMGWLPEGADTAMFGAAVATVLTGFSSFVLAVIGAYRAQPNSGPVAE